MRRHAALAAVWELPRGRPDHRESLKASNRSRTFDPGIRKAHRGRPIRSAPVRCRRMCPKSLGAEKAAEPIPTGSAGPNRPRQAQSRHSVLSVRVAS
jgi:hypothetical protein